MMEWGNHRARSQIIKSVAQTASRRGRAPRTGLITIQFALRTEHEEYSLEGREWYRVRKDSSLRPVESRPLGTLKLICLTIVLSPGDAVVVTMG